MMPAVFASFPRALAILLAGVLQLPAQDPAAAPTDRGGADLLRALGDLQHPDRRPAAMARLHRAGSSAAPLLLAAARKGGDGAVAALRVLAALGGGARPVLLPLQRLATELGEQRPYALDLTIAAIGERDSVLIADYGNSMVVELDGNGKELRRVGYPSVWSVQPLPGDRLLVAGAGNSKVAAIDWTGTEHWQATLPSAALDGRRLPDGTTVAACWNGNCAVGLDGEGRELWRVKELQAVDIELLWNGNFLIMGYSNRKVVEVTPAGEIVWTLALPAQAMDVDVLPNGNFLIAFDDAVRVAEFDRAGNELRSMKVPSDPEDCQRLLDGRTAVAFEVGGALLAADGTELWRYAGGQSGHVVARLQPATADAPPANGAPAAGETGR